MMGDVYCGSATEQRVALQTALWLREECDTTSRERQPSERKTSFSTELSRVAPKRALLVELWQLFDDQARRAAQQPIKCPRAP